VVFVVGVFVVRHLGNQGKIAEYFRPRKTRENLGTIFGCHLKAPTPCAVGVLTLAEGHRFYFMICLLYFYFYISFISESLESSIFVVFF